MKNQELRELIKMTGIHYWEVAQKVGIAQQTLTVWFHSTLTPDRKRRVNDAIKGILREREEIAKKIK